MRECGNAGMSNAECRMPNAERRRVACPATSRGSDGRRSARRGLGATCKAGGSGGTRARGVERGGRLPAPHVSTSSNERLSDLVARAEAGDATARDALFAALYDELHRLAQSHVRRGGNITLGATTLLHEAYLDIARRDALAFPDRQRFLGYASRAMRGLVIDYVRQRHACKRGGELTFTSLDEGRDDAAAAPAGQFEALGAAVEQLAALDPALAQLVDLKFFCGFTFAEIANLRGVAERTVQRDWAKARTLLHRFVGGDQLTR